MSARAALLVLTLLLAGGAEDVPDARLRCGIGKPARLADFWREQPLLLALVDGSCGQPCTSALENVRDAALDAGFRRSLAIVVASYSPADRLEHVGHYATRLGLEGVPDWSFCAIDPRDLGNVLHAVAKRASRTGDGHAFQDAVMLVAIRDGKPVRILPGERLTPARTRDFLAETF